MVLDQIVHERLRFGNKLDLTEPILSGKGDSWREKTVQISQTTPGLGEQASRAFERVELLLLSTVSFKRVLELGRAVLRGRRATDYLELYAVGDFGRLGVADVFHAAAQEANSFERTYGHFDES